MKFELHPQLGLLDREKIFPPLKYQQGPYLSGAFSSLTPKPVIDVMNSFYYKHRFASEGRDSYIRREIEKSYQRISRFFGFSSKESRLFVITDSCSSAISLVCRGLKRSDQMKNLYKISRNFEEPLRNFLTECRYTDISIKELHCDWIVVEELISYENKSKSFEDYICRLFNPIEITKKRPNIVIGGMDYLANIACWVKKAEEENLDLRIIPTVEISYDVAAAVKMIDAETVCVALTLISNFFGTENDLRPIIRCARKFGIPVCCDAAQALFQKPVNLLELNADFVCFSGHKAMGPMGTGLLFINPRSYSLLSPVYIGDAGASLSDGRIVFRDDITKFWSGVTSTDRIVAFSKIFEFVQSIGIDKICEYNQTIIREFRDQLKTLNFLHIPSKNYPLFGLCSFVPLYGISGNQLVDEFAKNNTAISGLKIEEFPFLSEESHLGSSVVPRVSVQVYNTRDDLARAFDLLKNIQNRLEKGGNNPLFGLRSHHSLLHVCNPWASRYITASLYKQICAYFKLGPLDFSSGSHGQKEQQLFDRFYNYITSEIDYTAKKTVVVIGCAPNNRPHYGTFLQILAGSILARYLHADFVLSFNDVESSLMRKTAAWDGYVNISKFYIPLLNRICTKYRIVVRSQDKDLLRFCKTIEKELVASEKHFFYGRELNTPEMKSISYMAGELLRYQLESFGEYDQVLTCYGIEELPHIMLINHIAKKLKIKPIKCLISQQIIGNLGHRKMSKSMPVENLYPLSEPSQEKNEDILFLDSFFNEGR